MVSNILENWRDRGWTETLLRNRGSSVSLGKLWAFRNSFIIQDFLPFGFKNSVVPDIKLEWSLTLSNPLIYPHQWRYPNHHRFKASFLLASTCGKDQTNGLYIHQSCRERNFEPRHAHQHIWAPTALLQGVWWSLGRGREVIQKGEPFSGSHYQSKRNWLQLEGPFFQQNWVNGNRQWMLMLTDSMV